MNLPTINEYIMFQQNHVLYQPALPKLEPGSFNAWIFAARAEVDAMHRTKATSNVNYSNVDSSLFLVSSLWICITGSTDFFINAQIFRHNKIINPACIIEAVQNDIDVTHKVLRRALRFTAESTIVTNYKDQWANFRTHQDVRERMIIAQYFEIDE